MATYTPNYNLGKPDDNDRYDLFRELFNDNMDIIDNISGGGGGSGYKSEVLFSNSGSSIPATITLSKGMSNYDMIVFSGYRQQYPTYWASSMYLSDEIETGRIITCGDDVMYAWYTVTDDTTLTSSGANLVIDKVYGLKFGSGGSGGVADVEVNGTSVVDPDTKIASITSYFAVVNGKLCQIYDDGN